MRCFEVLPTEDGSWIWFSGYGDRPEGPGIGVTVYPGAAELAEAVGNLAVTGHAHFDLSRINVSLREAVLTILDKDNANYAISRSREVIYFLDDYRTRN